MIPGCGVVSDLGAARRQSSSIAELDHRPWPLPDRTWLIGQTWLDLMFAHWRVDPDAVQRVLPPPFEPDLVDGSAWIAITPFELRSFRLRGMPPAPFVSAFPELNVRTYVTVAGKPGIYFLSLDAGSRLAVVAARRVYRFPYFAARMSVERDEAGRVEFRSTRADASGSPAEFTAIYAPRGAPFEPPPGSVEWMLVERYCAYTLDERGRVLRAQVHHRPWTLHAVDAAIRANTMTAPFGIELEGDPLLHLAARQDVIIWPHERVGAQLRPASGATSESPSSASSGSASS